jgi:glycosyltransferase involved in cell wall biosynthesis
MKINSPLVSVCMITYNHEKYIAEAIEGVLMQDVDFEVELVIADDASTDRTGEIVQKYIDNHPKGNWIKYTIHTQNIGMMPNFIWSIEKAVGKYMALCEGDDYWIDPHKLQNQVSFLETNPDFSICYHPIKILMTSGELVDDFIAEKYFKAPESTIFDLAIFGNYIHTPSVVFRKASLLISENFHLSPVGDYYLYVLLAQKGKIKRANIIGAVYRYEVGGFSRLDLESRKAIRKRTLQLLVNDVESITLTFIFWLRVFHDQLYRKITIETFESSEVKGLFSFFIFTSKINVVKSVVKRIFSNFQFKKY